MENNELKAMPNLKLKLDCIGDCEIVGICECKNDFLQDAFDMINSCEYNNLADVQDGWNALGRIYFKNINRIHKKVCELKNNNELQEKITKRNKLNREITTLKKATLNKK